MNILAVILAATAPMATRQAATNIAEHVVAEATPGIVAAAVAAVPAPDYSTANTQLVATIEATAPAPGNYAAVSNKAMNAVQKTGGRMTGDLVVAATPDMGGGRYIRVDYHGGADTAAKYAPGGVNVNWDAHFPEHEDLYGEGTWYTISWPYKKTGTVLLDSDPLPSYSDVTGIVDRAAASLASQVSLASQAATNYTDEVAGELSTSINQKYSKSSGEQLAQQVAAIGAHINGEDAKVIVTNYNSSTHLPEAEFDINVSNNWLVVWREMTRWNWFLGDVFGPHTNAVAHALANKAEKEYAFFDGVTGEPAPDGFFWISQPRVAICAGAAYQRYVDTAGEVWVLESNGMVADINGTTNGYFRISDDRNNVQFEIVKGNSRTVVAAPGAMTRSSVMGVTHWHTTYMVSNAVSPPKAMFCRDLANPEWYAEDDAGCPCNVEWTHPSERIYVCEWWTQGDEPKMFMRSQYGQGSESRIIQNAPVEMQYIVLGGTKYALGTATIDGKTVLTLSTP